MCARPLQARASPVSAFTRRRFFRPAQPAPGQSREHYRAAAQFRVHPTFDFGVIILPTPFRRPAQFMRLQPRGDANTATLLTIAGYPCDKPNGTMWGHSEKIGSPTFPTELRYT